MKLMRVSLLLIIGTSLVVATSTVPATTMVTATGTTGVPTVTITQMTTPQPTPMTFRLNDTDGHACILEQIEATFSITYNKTGGSVGTAQVVVPQNALVNPSGSMCGSNGTQPSLTLTWGDNGEKLIQNFTTSGNESSLTQIALSAYHSAAVFINSTQQGELVNYTAVLPAATFEVTNGMAFACQSDEVIKVNVNFTVTFSNVKVQTAGIVNDTFGMDDRCSGDMTTPMPTTNMMTTNMMTTNMTTNMTTTNMTTNMMTTNMMTTNMTGSPSPTLPPTNMQWTVKDKNNQICMLVNMTSYFIITYNTTDNKTTFANVSLPITADASTSVCSNFSSKFILTFDPDMELEMDFMHENGSSKYNNTILSLKYRSFTDSNANGTLIASTNETNIDVPWKAYYACEANRTFSSKQGNGTVQFYMVDVAIQAFAGANGGKRGNVTSHCAADDQFNNIVPIAVGCALAGLVIIVLIAYLIGRQRSSKTGYESV